MSDLTIFSLRVTGQVQGVGFRDWAVTEAGKHGLSGWVRNRSDGMVELMVAGPTERSKTCWAPARKGPRGGGRDQYRHPQRKRDAGIGFFAQTDTVNPGDSACAGA